MPVPQVILKVVKKALASSPIYSIFAKNNGISKIPKQVSDKLFRQLPISSKETYIHTSDINNLFAGRAMPPDIAYASSGSSGVPTFWFRNEQTIEQGREMHQFIFQHVFGIKPKEPTLVVVMFAMGLWVAGLFTADSCRAMREKKYHITTITPGIDRKEGLSALKKLKTQFKHVVIAGYPPFVLDFLREAKHESSDIHPSLFVLTAGDKFTENWRDEVLELMGKSGEYHRINSLYGSADAGPMGFETSHSIALRRASRNDVQLHRALFGNEQKVGGVYQFLPHQIFFEESKDGELILTKDMPIPLIRYNIHDKGKVYPSKKFKLPNRQKSGKTSFNFDTLPILSITGRTDVAVTLYALNIYPEHISGGLPKMYCTGSYLASTQTQIGLYSEQLVIDVELNLNTAATEDILQKVTQSVTDFLLLHNIEFRKLKNTIGESATPLIRLHRHGTLSIAQQTTDKALLQIAGKKPKVSLLHDA